VVADHESYRGEWQREEAVSLWKKGNSTVAGGTPKKQKNQRVEKPIDSCRGQHSTAQRRQATAE
jgi:hypothetical protein